MIDMRVLVAIAFYGTTNAPFVRQLIDEYRSMQHDVDIVVLSEAPKELTDVELRVGLPSPDPYSLPFAHKDLFVERRGDYDLYIYSEDDTLITESSIDAFMWATSVLPGDTIAGFLRTEEGSDGELRCSTVNSRFHWRPDSGLVAGGEVFAEYTNPHSAAFMLTSDQLDRVIDSGGFLTPPREGRLDMRVTAATDPYTRCGLTKLVCVTRLDDFLLPHLTNRYAESSIGISLQEFREQANAMSAVVSGDLAPHRLLCPTSRLDDARWDKLYWAPVDRLALESVPSSARRVLSVGVGSGATEEALARRGIEVVGIPLDEIVATSARLRGVTTTSADFREAMTSLSGQRFDAVLLSGSLQHFPDPTMVLREIRSALDIRGSVVITLPNHRREVLRWLLRRAARPPLRDNFAVNGVHLGSTRAARTWLRHAGFVADGTRHHGPGRPWLRSLVSPGFVIRADVGDLAARRPTPRSRPLVSVGVPVFNGGNYLEEALESIRVQDLSDFEVIICDNASTDDTQAICERYAAADPRFRYVRHAENLGAARNYNECFARSSGEFFTWLAHDDMRAPGFLSGCIEHFDDAGASAVLTYPEADFIDEEGTVRAHDTYSVEARSSLAHRRLAVAVTDTGAVNPIFGVVRSAVLEQTRLIGPFIASDRVLLAELAMLGQIHELRQTLSLRRLHPQMSTNAHVDKDDLTAWFDPNARSSRLNEVSLLGREFARSVRDLPLTFPERVACFATFPIRMLGRRGRIYLGARRQRLRAFFGGSLNRDALL